MARTRSETLAHQDAATPASPARLRQSPAKRKDVQCSTLYNLHSANKPETARALAQKMLSRGETLMSKQKSSIVTRFASQNIQYNVTYRSNELSLRKSLVETRTSVRLRSTCEEVSAAALRMPCSKNCAPKTNHVNLCNYTPRAKCSTRDAC
jgi:hypothetical protein